MSDGIPCPTCRMEAMPDGDGYVVCYNCEDPYHANMIHKSRWEVANKEIVALRSRVEELERENNRLASKAHDLLSQLEIATDLGQKRWMALNEIVEHAGMKSSDWCRRKAKEGLGLK